MGRIEWTWLGIFGAAFVGGAALASPFDSQLPWMLSRASGIAAFAVLSASVILGLLVSMRAGGRGIARAFNYEIHGFLSMLGLTLVGIHGGALLFDGFFHFTPLDLLVPFISPYAAFWTGLGVIAGWGVAIVTASFWMRGRIGFPTWRRLHYASFGAYFLALVHGLLAGSDTGVPVVAAIYVGSAAVVAGLILLRLDSRSRTAGAASPAAEAFSRRSA